MNLKKDKKGHFRYDMTVNGKRYRGSTYCTERDLAKKYVARLISEVKNTTGEDPIDVLIEDTWTEYVSAPGAGSPCLSRLKTEKAKWKNFIEFCKNKELKMFSDITEHVAQEYVKHLINKGRFTMDKKKERLLSSNTINDYISVCMKVAKTLVKNLRLGKSPFDNITKVKKVQTDRQPFTDAEIRLMMSNAEGIVRHLLTVGLYTGLRKGDICTLRWCEVDLSSRTIIRKQNKTGTVVNIPIAQPLYSYLRGIADRKIYVCQSAANMYESNPIAVTNTFKDFLKSLLIKSTEKTATGREASIKDIHSLRHTFAYIAARNNVPISTVKAILGHSDETITKIYAEHASKQDKQEAVEIVSSVTDDVPEETEVSEETDKISAVFALVDQMDQTNWQARRRQILRLLR